MIARARQLLARRAVALGVLGAVLLLAGGSLYGALVTPPYRFIDEQAHAGYVLAVQDGQLPTIDTPIDQVHAGPALRTRLINQPERRRDVWVANNPPLTYVVAAGPAALTRALGLPGGPLLGLRLVNVAAVGGAAGAAMGAGRAATAGGLAGAATGGAGVATSVMGVYLRFRDGVRSRGRGGEERGVESVSRPTSGPTGRSRSGGSWCRGPRSRARS